MSKINKMRNGVEPEFDLDTETHLDYCKNLQKKKLHLIRSPGVKQVPKLSTMPQFFMNTPENSCFSSIQPRVMCSESGAEKRCKHGVYMVDLDHGTARHVVR